MKSANRILAGATTGVLTPPSLQLALMNNLTVGALRSLSPLPDEAQREVDAAVVKVGRERLVVVQELINDGLVYTLNDALSVTELYNEMVSESGGAIRAMNPTARGENQLSDRTGYRTPIYITMDDFELGIRVLRASQRVGQPLDTSQVEQATRRVNEAVEDQSINGAGTIGGNAVYGLLTAPNATAVPYLSNEAWDVVGHSGEDILSDVGDMIDAAQADKRYGPYTLFVNTSYGRKISTEDFKANSDKTILSRLEEIQAGGRNLRVRVADQLPTNRTVLVQMTSDVIDLVNGQTPVAVPWTSADGFTLHWLVMAIQVVRVKTDYESRSGVVTGNLS